MSNTLTPDAVRHEMFCRPQLARGDGPEAKPRMERYIAYADMNGESIPVSLVTRCLECGVANYDPIGA